MQDLCQLECENHFYMKDFRKRKYIFQNYKSLYRLQQSPIAFQYNKPTIFKIGPHLNHNYFITKYRI